LKATNEIVNRYL